MGQCTFTRRACDLHAVAAAALQPNEVWHSIKQQASVAATSPLSALMRPYLNKAIGSYASLAPATAALLTERLGGALDSEKLMLVLEDRLAPAEELLARDLNAVVEGDPAAPELLTVFLHFKGFLALAAPRAAASLWSSRTEDPGAGQLALLLQGAASAATGVDIHPGCKLGRGVTIDHATGVVIGETAVVGDGCSLLHGVTLGGTGTEGGADRHPKIGRDVLLGANTSVLGNIRIGDGAKVGANSVVLQPIPSGATAVGAPAKVVGRAMESKPGTQNDTSMRDVVTVSYTHLTLPTKA